MRGKVCIIRNFTSTVWERKHSLPETSYLQHEKKAVQDEKKVYSIKMYICGRKTGCVV